MGRDEARSRRVIRADVARAAGVSTAVVSYVMNGGPRPVAPETAARVRAAMDDLGYRPNHAARTLNLGTTRTIGLVLQDTLNPYFAEFAGEIDRAARERGFGVLAAESHGDRDGEWRGEQDGDGEPCEEAVRGADGDDGEDGEEQDRLERLEKLREQRRGG